MSKLKIRFRSKAEKFDLLFFFKSLIPFFEWTYVMRTYLKLLFLYCSYQISQIPSKTLKGAMDQEAHKGRS